MKDKIIKGTLFANKILNDVSNKVSEYVAEGYRPPKLAVILIGEDPASSIYVGKKKQKCKEVGITSYSVELNEDVTEKQLIELIDELNNDKSVDGILVQLPLPKQINQQNILETISPNKDVDGFHPINVGRLMQRNPFLRPCTPFGIIKLLEDIGANVRGSSSAVVGASNIVGRPMTLELLLAGSTVTTCHRFTTNLKDIVSRSDIVIVGVGQPGIVKGHWFKKGAIAIDVGINRLDTGKLVGDIEFEEALSNVSMITPVPGGIGPITVAQLMDNTLFAYKNNIIGSTVS